MALPSTAPPTSPTPPAGPSSRPLLVPAADVLAKNMHAQEEARGVHGLMTGTSDEKTPNLLMGLGTKSETKTLRRHKQARFRRASTSTQSNPLVALISRLFGAKSANGQSKDSEESEAKEASPPRFMKLMPPLEKASGIISKAPNPLIIFLVLTLVVIIIDRVRPQWLRFFAVQLVVTFLLWACFLLALIWRKTALFVMIREGRSLYTHPADHRLDGAEADVKAREQRVHSALETLKSNQSKLDALKKELAKEGNVRNADGFIVPSRRAALMITEGALGAGFDAANAQEVEQRRREENMKKWREEWRARAEQTENDRLETNESLKLMADHAATAYTKRTRELKTKQSPTSKGAADKFLNLPKKLHASTVTHLLDARAPRSSRHSERSVQHSGADTSVTTHRRHTMFRLRRRHTTTEQDARQTMSDTGQVRSRRR